MKSVTYSALAIIGLMLASAGAQAQSSNGKEANTLAKQSKAVADSASLAEWEYNSIYEAGGIRAEYMISEEVFGPKGNEIGNVENAIISHKGQILALIIRAGGFWDISNTYLVVPWKQVKLIPDGFQVPVTEQDYEQYVLFGDQSFVTMKTLQQVHPVNDILATGAQTWKLTALLDDYVLLNDGTPYGYVNDVLFSKNGQIMAIMVTASAAYGAGVYAFPFNGYMYGWQPYDNVYTLPYEAPQVETLAPFDYGSFDGYWH